MPRATCPVQRAVYEAVAVFNDGREGFIKNTKKCWNKPWLLCDRVMLYTERKTKDPGSTQVGRINKETSNCAPGTKQEEDNCKKQNSEGNSYKAGGF